MIGFLVKLFISLTVSLNKTESVRFTYAVTSQVPTLQTGRSGPVSAKGSRAQHTPRGLSGPRMLRYASLVNNPHILNGLKKGIHYSF